MASLAANVVGGNLATGIFDGVSKIIGLFHLSPEQQAEHAETLAKIQQEMVDRAQDYAQAQIDDATKNIQAEAAAGSKARPAFMAIIEWVLVFDFIICPVWNAVCSGFGYTSTLNSIPLPTNLLVLFGVCLTGYTAFDKIMQVMNLPGASSFEIPNLLKMGNKS